MLGIIGLIVSLVALMYLSYKRWSAILIAIVASLIVGLTNQMGVWQILTEYFMPGAISFIQPWFLVFTLGAIFSEFLTRSGSVAAIAYKLLDVFGKRNAILVIALICATLTIGGVNPYVLLFMVWPICITFSRETHIPRGMWIGVFYMGLFSSYSFPGNPGMTNVIVAQGLGVSGSSEPIFSLFLFIVYFTLGMVYFKWREKSWRKKGLEYGEDERDKKFSLQSREGVPNFWKSFAPMLLVVVLFSTLSSNQLTFLPTFTSMSAVQLSMLLGTLLCIILNFSVIKPQLKDALVQSSTGGVGPVMTAAVITGYLYVIMASPTYALFIEKISGISGGPFVQAFIACNVLAFITGGGATAAPPIFTAFKDSWVSAGVSTSVLRPVMVQSLSGVCVSPHCGGLHGVYDYTGSDMKESYTGILFGSIIPSVLTSLIGVIVAITIL